MSSRLRKKNGEPTRENVLPLENRESTGENVLQFSYNLACPLLRRENQGNPTWIVIQKGSEKLNPEQETEISYSTIRSALFQIREHISKTPLLEDCLKINDSDNYQICLKTEFNQITNSVKARGVAYTLLQLSDERRNKGVVAISTGSFAYTLCYYGKKFEIPVTVVMPTSTPNKTVKMCRDNADSEATVLVQGKNMLEAHKIALCIAKSKGLFYLDGNDHPNMIIGQATLGLEITEQMIKPDAVVLPTPIDGCGLTLGIAAAIKAWDSNIKVFEVQTTVLNCLIQDIRKQTTSHCEFMEIPVTQYVMYDHLLNSTRKSLIDDVLFVNGNSVCKAADLLKTINIVDSYGAIGLAAFLTPQLKELDGQRVVIPLFGKMDFN